MSAQEQAPAAAPPGEAPAHGEDSFRALVEQSIAGIYVIQDGRVVYANPKFCEIFGYSREEFAQGGVPLEQLTSEPDLALVRENVRRRLAGEVRSMHYTFRARRKDGAPIEVEVHGARTELAGRPAITGTLLDITERRSAERALRQSEERYALAERGANDGLWDWDLAANRVYLSPRWKQMLGLREDELGGDPEAWFERVHPDDRARLSADVARHLSGDTPNLEVEHRIRHADGTWRWVLLRGTAVRDAQGKATRMAGSQTDVTERKEAEEKLLHDALHDALTGLANRSLFMDRLRQAMAFQQRKPDLRFAVLFLDVDRFKNINESLGHAMGDRLLVSVGKRLLGCIRPGDTVARLGGDEFALLLEDYGAPEDPARCAERIQTELAPAHDLGGVEVFATASIGIAVAGRGYTRPPIPPCTGPSSWGAPATRCSTRRCTRTPARSCSSRPTSTVRSSATSCASPSSPSSRSRPGSSRAARPWSSGSTPSAGASRPPSSSPPPRRPASSSPSANGCCASPARRRVDSPIGCRAARPSR
jgi:diguanylate cyclase (GGDEF)-like protein/PAS domain S-box-containing protein